jgi:hypothetical protein
VTTSKDTFGWEQSQARTYDAACRHTALTALAQLRTAAICSAMAGLTILPDASPGAGPGAAAGVAGISDPDLRIPLGDAPLPAHGGQPARPASP